MLKIANLMVDDSKAEKIITKHISENLKELMRAAAIDCPLDREVSEAEDEHLIDYIAHYFPENYPEEKMRDMFYGLYALLDSDEEYVPKLAMEYLMAKLIDVHISMCEDVKADSRVLVTEERAYLMECIRKEVIASGEYEEVSEINEMVDCYMRSIECLEEYLETCFWDADYMLLDSYTEEKLIDSGANEQLGIGIEERERFVVPTKWIK